MPKHGAVISFELLATARRNELSEKHIRENAKEEETHHEAEEFARSLPDGIIPVRRPFWKVFAVRR